jgi:hypothetical protein
MKNTVKTRSIFTIITIMIFAIFLSNCRKDNGEKFTIRGKLLNSCDNPEPVSGHQLFLEFSYGINNKYEQIAATTNADGSFEFTYEKKNAMGEMTISGRQANGLGTLNYLFGIPIGRDLNIENLYIENNFFAIIRVNIKRITTSDDTIFYSLISGTNNFSKFLVGPFTDNQLFDTVMYHNAQFFDLAKEKYYQTKSHAYFPWKLNTTGKIKEIWAMHEPCKKYNFYDLVIE